MSLFLSKLPTKYTKNAAERLVRAIRSADHRIESNPVVRAICDAIECDLLVHVGPSYDAYLVCSEECNSLHVLSKRAIWQRSRWNPMQMLFLCNSLIMCRVGFIYMLQCRQMTETKSDTVKNKFDFVKLHPEAAKVKDELVSWRRFLHTIPEAILECFAFLFANYSCSQLGLEENETPKWIVAKLKSFGHIEVHEGVGKSLQSECKLLIVPFLCVCFEGKTGVVGILKGEKSGKCLAFRADMDGKTDLQTTTQFVLLLCTFCSFTNPGACRPLVCCCL